MPEYKSVKHHWNRPPLPENNTGPGFRLGWIMIIFGISIIYGGSWFVIDWAGLTIAGSGLVSLGVVALTISAILREIRHLAFEAAMRAGEVEIEERKAKHRSAG